ncbi:MAG: hypothetical protein ABI704_31080 [Kofleriaceae bacterium]
MFGLAACAGEIGGSGGDDNPIGTGSDTGPPVGGGGGGGSATARDYFNANVYPIVSASCGSSGCHSATTPGANAPGYVSQTTPTQDGSAAWTVITGMGSVVGAYTATAPLVSIPTTTAHYATFTADQVTTITNWLALEASWRSASGGTTAVDYMAQWSGCMQYTDFMTANVATAYAQQVNTNEGYCKQCHVNGQAQSYFVATPDAQNMFTTITTYREYLSTFFTIDTTTNTVIVNTIPFKLAAQGGTNGAHPNQWNALTNKGMTALTKFATLTTEHLNGTTAPACGVPTLTD